nr:MAG TPA: hypothetical protein [Caudoviricetes sp.]
MNLRFLARGTTYLCIVPTLVKECYRCDRQQKPNSIE